MAGSSVPRSRVARGSEAFRRRVKRARMKMNVVPDEHSTEVRLVLDEHITEVIVPSIPKGGVSVAPTSGIRPSSLRIRSILPPGGVKSLTSTPSAFTAVGPANDIRHTSSSTMTPYTGSPMTRMGEREER